MLYSRVTTVDGMACMVSSFTNQRLAKKCRIEGSVEVDNNPESGGSDLSPAKTMTENHRVNSTIFRRIGIGIDAFNNFLATGGHYIAMLLADCST